MDHSGASAPRWLDLIPMLPGGWHTALLVLAVVGLLWPLPRLLQRARWLTARPRAALGVWAACGIASGVGLVASTLCCVHCLVTSRWLARGSRTLSAAVLGADHSREGQALVGVLVAAVVGLWLLGCLTLTCVGLARRRRRHLAALHLVGDWQPDLGAVVVDGRIPMAYCVPGLLRSTVVVSRGCLEATDEAELAAILAHERAHARGHHDLLVTAFLAWRRALPFVPGARAGLPAVREATELIADDAAALRVGAQATVSAIHRLHARPSPVPEEDAGGHDDGGDLVSAPSAGRSRSRTASSSIGGGVAWEPDRATVQRVRRLLARSGPEGRARSTDTRSTDARSTDARTRAGADQSVTSSTA